MSSTTKIGTKEPIIIEFTYNEWRRLERLSNRDKKWIYKFYNAVLAKAGLILVEEVRNRCGHLIENARIVLGKNIYNKFERTFEKKINDARAFGMINLQCAPKQDLCNSIGENQIAIFPKVFRLTHWKSHVFK